MLTYTDGKPLKAGLLLWGFTVCMLQRNYAINLSINPAVNLSGHVTVFWLNK